MEIRKQKMENGDWRTERTVDAALAARVVGDNDIETEVRDMKPSGVPFSSFHFPVSIFHFPVSFFP